MTLFALLAGDPLEVRSLHPDSSRANLALQLSGPPAVVVHVEERKVVRVLASSPGAMQALARSVQADLRMGMPLEVRGAGHQAPAPVEEPEPEELSQQEPEEPAPPATGCPCATCGRPIYGRRPADPALARLCGTCRKPKPAAEEPTPEAPPEPPAEEAPEVPQETPVDEDDETAPAPRKPHRATKPRCSHCGKRPPADVHPGRTPRGTEDLCHYCRGAAACKRSQKGKPRKTAARAAARTDLCTKCSKHPQASVRSDTPRACRTLCQYCRAGWSTGQRTAAPSKPTRSHKAAPVPKVQAPAKAPVPGLGEPGLGTTLHLVERALRVCEALGGVERAERFAEALAS